MAREVWTLLLMLLLLALGHAHSGGGDDEDVDEDEDPGVDCSAKLSLEDGNSLTCLVDEDLIGSNIIIRLNSKEDQKECWNLTLNGSSFTVPIKYIVIEYLLIIPGRRLKILNIRELVHLPAPQTVEAMYVKTSGDVNISVGYKHDFVKSFKFEVHIFNATYCKAYENPYEPFIIEKESLGDMKAGSEYFVKVRVKPDMYFKGHWSDWSQPANFTVDKAIVQSADQVVLYIIIIAVIIILLLTICLVTRFRRKAIKAYILPNVAHPKTTLFHMQKFNKGLLLSFKPETFSDIHINRLDVVGEDKPLAPEPADGQERAPGTRSRCPSQLSQVLLWTLPLGNSSARGSQSTLQDKERDPEDHRVGGDASSAGLRLLDATVDPGDSDPISTNVHTPQRECKDEAYVTMSSLFKTQ